MKWKTRYNWTTDFNFWNRQLFIHNLRTQYHKLMKKQTSQQKAKHMGDQEFKTRSQNWIATQIYFDIRSISFLSFCYLFHVKYHYLLSFYIHQVLCRPPGGGPRLDRRAGIQFGWVHFWGFSTVEKKITLGRAGINKSVTY